MSDINISDLSVEAQSILSNHEQALHMAILRHCIEVSENFRFCPLILGKTYLLTIKFAQ
jgi:hypothetical protein